MSLALISIMLALPAADTPAPAAPDPPAATFTSTKNLAALQQCLTDKLAEVGEVVALKTEGDTTTLLVRDNPDGPMTIDLAPPKVIVTSRFITGSQKLVKACL